MAIFVSTQTGNWTSSSTWNQVNDASYMGNLVGDNTIGAATTSQSFTTGAVTLSGVCVYLASRNAIPIGTLTVSLINVTASTVVAGTSITCNVSDFPSTGGGVAANTIGWTFFRFPAPVTLAAATTYAVRLVTSSGNQMSAWRANIASDWVRALVTTTTGAPTTNDDAIIVGQYLTAGTSTTTSVTMNNTNSSIVYSGVSLGLGGNLSYGTNPSTNYSLRLRNLTLGIRTTFEIGNSVTPIPSTSTAVLEFTATTSATIFRNFGGTFNAYGSPLSYISAKLSGDVTAGNTTTITNVSTGWRTNDRIVVTSTNTTTTQTELLTITGITGTTITHAPYSFSHGGNATTLVQADIVNLTRNIKIFSTSNVNRAINSSVGYISGTPATYNLYNLELYDIGTFGSTTGALQMGSFTNATISGCSFYNTTASGNNFINYNASSTALAGFLNVYDTVFYTGFTAINYVNNISGSTILNNVYTILNSNGISTPGLFGTYSGITASNNSTRAIAIGVANSTVGFNLTISDANIYGNATGIGIIGNYRGNINFNNNRIWRNITPITNVLGASSLYPFNKFSEITFNNAYVFGNTNGLNFYPYGRFVFNNSYFWGGTGVTTSYAILLNSVLYGVCDTMFFNNCNFGVDYLNNPNNFSVAVLGVVFTNGGSIVFNNSLFSGTESAIPGGTINFGIMSIYSPFGYVSLNHNNVSGSNRFFTNIGTLTTDAGLFNVLSPSIRMTPTNASLKLRTSMFRVPVQSGQTCNISVWVRKSTAGDGTNYNGSQPRLIYVYNPFAGNTTETIGTTATAANGVWEQLTYTTPVVTANTVCEFYVDCDGTTGWVNVDDWSTNTFNNSKSGGYWGPNGMYVEPDYRNPGGSYTFIS